MAKIILTGDRPTGKLHIGHYVGSLRNRVLLQNSGEYDEIYIMIADAQALTDNFDNPDKVRENILEVALDYLACGIDPSKTTIFIQSEISQLTELTFYYMNLVSVSRLQRNPTVKAEIKMRGFDASIPVGFQCYPISQAADITAFKATTVPAGEDQMPMIEQTQEIVHKFNSIYGETLVEPKILLPQNCACLRLPGTDGKAKMSKSLGNCIYLSDDEETIKKKVMSMYTDPDHIKVSDPGKIEGNCVFTYLDAFCKPEHFEKYLPEYENLDALKAHYQRGGLGDVKVKRFLNSVMQEELAPIRERRLEWQAKLPEVVKILEEGTKKAYATAEKTLENFMGGIGIAHFEHIMSAQEMHGMNRVYAKVTLKKGCSVGYHVHNGDGEDYFVLSGVATLDDNHERTLYLKPGEHYFTPSGKGHSILNEQDEDLVFMALIIYDSQQKM